MLTSGNHSHAQAITDFASALAAQATVREPALVVALDSFAGNWAVHRQDLLSSMQAVYKMATESHKAYIETDDSLARDIRLDGTP
jgi:hypothetical protein